eukprot:COSAG06_NODE_618_length_13744_cov_19.800220_10_plen_85_part_00
MRQCGLKALLSIRLLYGHVPAVDRAPGDGPVGAILTARYSDLLIPLEETISLIVQLGGTLRSDVSSCATKHTHARTHARTHTLL